MSAGETARTPPTWSRGSCGFNEAPACLPGKPAQLPKRVHVDGDASMRPRRVCRGNEASGSPSRLDVAACFNEAPACLPGKRAGGGAI